MINLKNKIFNHNNSVQGGYTVVELIFYIALFALLSLSVINSMITMTKAFKETTVEAELAHGSLIMERISREIRKANDIESIGATDLNLNTQDDAGADKTVEFLLTGSNLELLEDGVLTGNLNTPNLTVSGLAFTSITTAQGKAVKIFFTVHSLNDVSNRAVDFYDTVVLRGVY